MSRDDHLCWFHGKLTRENAEEKLKNEDGLVDGTFLIRESNTAIGDYVLTVLYQTEVCHYQIRRHGEDAFFSIDDKVKILHGLDTLVEFYQQDSHGLVTKLTKMLRKDPPPNDSRSHGVTNLLHRATKENNHTVVSELLKCGYRNVDAKNQDGQTAVHLACALHGDEAILKLLLGAGVNLNCMDTLGNMPLHYACRSKSTSFVRILIEAHASVQGRNIRNGYVPMHEAAKHGNLDVIRELLSFHAPLLPRTSFGEFPIDLAKEFRHQAVVDFLNSYKMPTPATYKWQWYHGTLERSDAINTLMEFAKNKQEEQRKRFAEAQEAKVDATNDLSADGDKTTEANVDTSGYFLIRYSERKGAGSGYVLTLLWNNNAKNFIISQSSHYLYIDEGPYLPSLEHLVEHFMRFADGLPVNLKYSVPPKPKPPLPLFSTMPRSSPKKLLGTNEFNVDQMPPPPPAALKDAKEMPLSTPNGNIHSIEKRSHTLATHKPKQKHKENATTTSSVFNTLKLRSPKKSIIMDSMNSLRKSKSKCKSTIITSDEKKQTKIANDMNELQMVEPAIKNLSFSADFCNLQLSDEVAAPPPTDEFYNVPRNNAYVEGVTTTGSSSSNGGGGDGGGSGDGDVSLTADTRTDEELEYFTKSDVAIERERSQQLHSSHGLPTSPPLPPPPPATNANGYIATVDIRIIMDPPSTSSPSLGVDALEVSAAELRALSDHPERLDSLMSTNSTESSINRYLNRQCSSVSNTSQASDVSGQRLPNYFIARDRLELDTIIGEGEFGSVYRGRLLYAPPPSSAAAGDSSESSHGNDVAIKTLRDEHCRTNKQEFLREASVMIRLQHHCIVQLLGISKGETLMMVQEIVSLGSMLNYIQEHRTQIKANFELKLWASQIACGMQYLESHHFVHRDLAARNILLASRNQAKISDFGLSRALGSGNDCYQASQGGKWPIKWYAPESYNNGLFSHASDVWSFGVTLWEMFSLGEAPYGDMRGVEAIQLIESGKRLSQPPLCPPPVYETMKNCWNYKPKDRPTFRYLIDAFAKDPDYQNIMELIKTEHIN